MSAVTVVAFILCFMATLDHGSVAKRREPGRHTFLVPRILSLEHCKDERKHSLVVHNFTSVVDSKGIVYVSTFLEFMTTLKSATLFKIVLRQCREAVTSNTCEYFATWPMTGNLCGLVQAKGMMWSSFMRSFQPTLKCPVTKGSYKVENATIDVSLGETISHINIAGFVWNVEVTINDEQRKLWTCLNTAILINRVNIKD